jgi:hypothetical protein
MDDHQFGYSTKWTQRKKKALVSLHRGQMKESVCVHHYYITFVCRRKYTRAYNNSSTNTLEYIYRSKTQVHIKVTQKVKRLKGQFWHNRASNAQLGMKILQNQIIGTQTSFCINFSDKLSFILSFLFLGAPPLLLHIFSPLLHIQLLL